MEYFAPLSSPKIKHLTLKNTIDLIKIDNGKYGVVNFNNMIPVFEKHYELFDLNSVPKNEKELQRQNLLKTQIRWLNKHQKIVKGKAVRLYNFYKRNRPPKRIQNSCCNFILLEEKCKHYNP